MPGESEEDGKVNRSWPPRLKVGASALFQDCTPGGGRCVLFVPIPQKIHYLKEDEIFSFRAKRQLYYKGATSAEFALHLYASAMELDDVLCYSKAESASTLAP